jgi:beta-glucanase (GH16 family)
MSRSALAHGCFLGILHGCSQRLDSHARKQTDNQQRIQNLVAIGLLILLSPFALGQPSRTEGLVWSDEFDGEHLDFSKWECEVNAFGGGNQELQLYTDSSKNVRVEKGLLIIQAHRDNPGIQGTTREYSSARIRTKRRGDWQYGRLDIRAKLPEGQGMWPAIWMLPSDEKYGGWAASGEIDIMEFKGHDKNKIYASLHYGDPWPKNRFTTGTHVLSKGNFCESFHTFSIDWREKKIVWLVDDQPIQTLTDWDSAGAKYPAPFDQPFHLLINLSVGGGFVGAPDATTVFPQNLEVDYVRVYR